MTYGCLPIFVFGIVVSLSFRLLVCFFHRKGAKYAKVPSDGVL